MVSALAPPLVRISVSSSTPTAILLATCANASLTSASEGAIARCSACDISRISLLSSWIMSCRLGVLVRGHFVKFCALLDIQFSDRLTVNCGGNLERLAVEIREKIAIAAAAATRRVGEIRVWTCGTPCFSTSAALFITQIAGNFRSVAAANLSRAVSEEKAKRAPLRPPFEVVDGRIKSGDDSWGIHEHPVVLPHVSHFKHVPLRTSVKFPHSPHISPS